MTGESLDFTLSKEKDKEINAAAQQTSVTTVGAQAAGGDSYSPALSADGRYVAFQSRSTNLVSGDTNGTSDIFVKDLSSGGVARASGHDPPSRTVHRKRERAVLKLGPGA